MKYFFSSFLKSNEAATIILIQPHYLANSLTVATSLGRNKISIYQIKQNQQRDCDSKADIIGQTLSLQAPAFNGNISKMSCQQ